MLGSSIDTIAFGTSEREAHYAGVDEGYFDVLRLPILRGPRHRAHRRGAAPSASRSSTRRWRGSWRRTATRSAARSGSATPRRRWSASRATPSTPSLDETDAAVLLRAAGAARRPQRALLVRGPAATAGPAIVEAVRAADPRLPAPRVAAFADEARVVLFPQRAAAIVTGRLGVTGLLLAALGLYGTVAGSAAARTREIGIRLALGAGRGEVLRTVVGEGARLAIAGIVVGLPLAALSMPLLRQWLFEIDPLDPATYAALSLVLVAVALVASYLPARRAAATDPLRALGPWSE